MINPQATIRQDGKSISNRLPPKPPSRQSSREYSSSSIYQEERIIEESVLRGTKSFGPSSSSSSLPSSIDSFYGFESNSFNQSPPNFESTIGINQNQIDSYYQPKQQQHQQYQPQQSQQHRVTSQVNFTPKQSVGKPPIGDSQPVRRQVSFELEINNNNQTSPKSQSNRMMQQDSYQQNYQQPQMVDEELFRQQMEQQQYYNQQYEQQVLQEHYRQQEERRLQEMQQQQQQQQVFEQFYDNNNYDNQNTRQAASKPLVLHMGSLVQFPSKDPNPNAPKPPEAPHLGEEVQAREFVRPTVLQFPRSIRDPNAKLPDGSHLGEEEHRPLLRQGGVVQFPKEFKQPLDLKGYHPVDEVVKETMPQAEVEHPDHLLPSQARKQQTYITHPVHSVTRVKPAFSNEPGSRRSNVQWPPQRSSIRHLPRVGFNSGHIHPEGSKHFIWPPPRPQFHRSMQELPPPGSGPASNAWHPSELTNGESGYPHYRPTTVGRIKPVWPPPERSQLKKQSSLPETRKKLLEFEEYMRHHAGIHVPPTYHAPPGTQYYETQYELVQG